MFANLADRYRGDDGLAIAIGDGANDLPMLARADVSSRIVRSRACARRRCTRSITAGWMRSSTCSADGDPPAQRVVHAGSVKRRNVLHGGRVRSENHNIRKRYQGRCMRGPPVAGKSHSVGDVNWGRVESPPFFSSARDWAIVPLAGAGQRERQRSGRRRHADRSRARADCGGLERDRHRARRAGGQRQVGDAGTLAREFRRVRAAHRQRRDRPAHCRPCS